MINLLFNELLTGLPLVCAATLRSLTHCNALLVFDNRIAPGESPKLIGVREQRVTTVVVNALLGESCWEDCFDF